MMCDSKTKNENTSLSALKQKAFENQEVKAAYDDLGDECGTFELVSENELEIDSEC
ncbi:MULTISPECIES: hypothetical protein [Vibrio]|uniref:hypothetical protein n=1 Tax=Vibrio TaxID=662 RepID=UPI0015E1164F|nr:MULTISPECIES: hypothetical protein [Vibrio]MCZ5870237.1 hypothetical protein [Vibrio parahaemolyticus]MCZ5900553.1 hypothetical protein [Vibrio parahaemolyticus]MCZ6308877.1 hypothetical protein [Vibrio parahaemolyticus]